MRFSTTAVATLGFPLLAAAEGDLLSQAQALFNKYVPNPNRYDAVGAAEAKLGEMKLHTLTLNNWNETLFSNTNSQSTKPDEWWVFVTGGKKSCFGTLSDFFLHESACQAQWSYLALDALHCFARNNVASERLTRPISTQIAANKLSSHGTRPPPSSPSLLVRLTLRCSTARTSRSCATRGPALQAPCGPSRSSPRPTRSTSGSRA